MTNPEIIEKWKVEFISLLEKSQSYKTIFLHRADGVFLSDPVESAWQGFLMARESVVIELPEYSVDRLSRILDADEVEVAITNSGYTYDY